MAIDVGSIVEGVVTGITNFGAFIELPDKVTGLVHISEVADAYVKDVPSFLESPLLGFFRTELVHLFRVTAFLPIHQLLACFFRPLRQSPSPLAL